MQVKIEVTRQFNELGWPVVLSIHTDPGPDRGGHALVSTVASHENAIDGFVDWDTFVGAVMAANKAIRRLEDSLNV